MIGNATVTITMDTRRATRKMRSLLRRIEAGNARARASAEYLLEHPECFSVKGRGGRYRLSLRRPSWA